MPKPLILAAACLGLAAAPALAQPSGGSAANDGTARASNYTGQGRMGTGTAGNSTSDHGPSASAGSGTEQSGSAASPRSGGAASGDSGTGR